jgi:hypothetical protein
VANGFDGFFLGAGTGQKFELNTALGNVDDGVQVGANAEFAAFKRNNAVDNDCGIETAAVAELLYIRQYFENNATVDTCGGPFDMEVSETEKPNPLKVNVARKL